MSLLHLAFREIRHRLLGFLLGALATTAAVALFLGVVTAGRASVEETKRLTRDLGFNVLIVPGDTDMARFWAADYPEGDMPEEYVQKLAATPGIGADHYVAMLQRKVRWQGHDMLLTGILPEYTAVDAATKAPMGYKLGRGKCYLGFVLARRLGAKGRDTIQVLGKKLTVERVLLEDGSKEDIRLYAHLPDVQDMLGMEGRINTIEALNCLCDGGSLDVLRAKIATALPDTHVTQMRTIAEARIETRRMAKDYAAGLLAITLVLCALWIGFLAMLNVRERRAEIGILRALGFGSLRLAALFLTRTALMGLFGALIGFFLGTALALHFGPELFRLTFRSMEPAYDLLLPSLLVVPGISALAGLLPALVAVTQDPAVTLMDE